MGHMNTNSRGRFPLEGWLLLHSVRLSPFFYFDYLTLIRPGGGHISPPVFQKIIALEPNVGLTSDQAVNSSFSVVLRSKKRKRPIRTMKGPWRALFYRGSPGISLAGSIMGSILGSMMIKEGPLALGRVPQ